MASRSSPSRLLGLVPLLGAAGCGDPCEGQRTFEAPPEPDPDSPQPTILAGEWIGSGVLELQFSEPLGSIGDLDPDRFRIITWAARAEATEYGARECLVQTDYRGLIGGYYQVAVAAAWIGPEDDTRLRLLIDRPGARCPTFTGAVETGVLLAYSDGEGGGPALLDENGTPVPDIGPGWAISQLDACLDDENQYYYFYCNFIYNFANGHLPALTSLALIPCP